MSLTSLSQSLLFLVLLYAIPAKGQWEDMTEYYLVEASTQASWLGCGMSLADFNLDGLDDLTFAESNGLVSMYAQMLDGGFELVNEFDGQVQGQGLAWFDVDRDEDLDLMITRRFGSMQLFIQEEGQFVDEAEIRGIPLDDDWESRGLAVADYDNDGDLDVYIGMYHDGATGLSENILLNNDGTGFFDDVTAEAGVGNGLKHTFQATWYDFDADGDLDLWVVNDRGVFPNALYENLGDGTFEDVATSMGADQAIWGMTATLGDYDNDGDQELFCTNVAEAPNLALDLVGEQYVSVGEWNGLNGSRYSWGACWVDADGDMWSDLMVATYRFPNFMPYDNYYYKNTNEGLFFEDLSSAWPNEQTQLYCVGVVDVNQDLAPDVIGYGNMSFVQILQNTPDENEIAPGRLAVRLCGTESNRWAIGGQIQVHAGGVVQTQLISNGSDFMTQQSNTRYFALANESAADSIVVLWPSGSQETWYDVAAGTTAHLIEGSAEAQLELEGGLCEDEATLVSPFDAPVIRWNGVVSDSLTLQIDTAGTYVLQCEWMGGLFVWTDTLVYELEPTHEITVEWSEPNCFGETGMLGWNTDSSFVVEFSGEQWGSQSSSIPWDAGEVVLTTTNLSSGCQVGHIVNLPEPPALGLYLVYLPAACSDDLASVEALGYGGTPSYLINWFDADPNNLPEGEVPLSLTDAQGCTIDSSIIVVIPDPLVADVELENESNGNDGSIALQISGGTPPYETLWNNGTLGDTALTGLSAGLYSWVISDAHGCLLLGLQELVNLGSDESLVKGRWGWQMTEEQVVIWAPEDVSGRVVFQLYHLDGRLAIETALEGAAPWKLNRFDLPAHGSARIMDGEGNSLFHSMY